MTYRRYWLRMLIGFILVSVFGAMGFLSIQDPAARYNGKTIESWFYDETRLGSSDYAVRAYEAVGESWIPYLIEKGNRPEKSMAGVPYLVYSLMPGFVRSQIGIVRHPEHDRGIAFSHLGSLHSVDSVQTEAHYLDPFVPELMEAANSTKDRDARRFLRRLLTHYVLELEDTDEKVSFFLKDAESSSVRLRFEAFVNLSKVDPTVTNGVPILTKVLKDRTWLVSAFEMGHLQRSGPDSPLSLAIYNCQMQAYGALSLVAPEVAAKYEIPERKSP